MVEVFKTDVQERCHANLLMNEIHQSFHCYKANFDLQDCDRILRVECITGEVQAGRLIGLLKDFGFEATILPDELPVNNKTLNPAYVPYG